MCRKIWSACFQGDEQLGLLLPANVNRVGQLLLAPYVTRSAQCQSDERLLVLCLHTSLNLNGARQSLVLSQSAVVTTAAVADFLGTDVGCVLLELSVHIRGECDIMLGGAIGLTQRKGTYRIGV